MNLQHNEVAKIDRNQLALRLLSLGWKRRKRPGYFIDPQNRLFYLPPQLEQDLDYVALTYIVESLLVSEHLNEVSDLMSRLSGKKEDLLYFGAEVIGHPPGRLPVAIAPDFYGGMTRFIRTTTTAVAKSRESDFLKRVSYGTSEAGSYQVTVHVPVDSMPDPVGRRMVRQAVEAFTSLERATDLDSPEPLLESVWTAPMCEAILELTERDLWSEIKLQAAPDPIWPDLKPIESRVIEIPLGNSPARSVLSSAAAALQKLKLTQYVTIAGIPFASRNESIIGEGDRRTVTIQWLRDGESPLKVKVLLTESSYRQSMDAIAKQKQIEISGWLRQEGRGWVLEADGAPNLFEYASAWENGPANPAN